VKGKKGGQCMQSRCGDAIRNDKLARDRPMSSEHAVLTEGVRPGYSNVILI
jgi:hypothetical protein